MQSNSKRGFETIAQTVELLQAFLFPVFISSVVFWLGLLDSTIMKHIMMSIGILCLLSIVVQISVYAIESLRKRNSR